VAAFIRLRPGLRVFGRVYRLAWFDGRLGVLLLHDTSPFDAETILRSGPAL